MLRRMHNAHKAAGALVARGRLSGGGIRKRSWAIEPSCAGRGCEVGCAEVWPETCVDAGGCSCRAGAEALGLGQAPLEGGGPDTG